MESEGKGGQHTGREDFFFFSVCWWFRRRGTSRWKGSGGRRNGQRKCASAEAEDGNPCPTTRARIWVDGGGVGGLWFVRVSEDVRFQVRNQVRVVSILSAQLHPSFPLPASFSSLSLSNSLPGCSRPTRRPCLLLMVGRRFFTELHFFFSDISGKRSRIDRGCVAGEASAGELH